MTLTTTTARMDYVGTGSAGPFSYTFRILDADDLEVTRQDATGGETSLVYPTDFSVTGVRNRSGGTITLTSALAVGETLTIRRVLAIRQPTDLRNLGAFLPETIEDQFDRCIMIDQSLAEDIERSLRYPVSVDPDTVSAELPVPEASKILGWNATGTALENQLLATSDNVVLPAAGRTVTTLTAYLANNVVFNVKDFGAVGDGATNDTAAFLLWATALNVAGGTGRIPTTANGYLVTDTISITNHGVRITGDSWRGTGILFNPATFKICFDFICSNAATTLTNCGIAHLYGFSTTTVQKTFIRLTDISGFEMTCVRTALSWSSAAYGTTTPPTSPSIGLETRGREILRASSIEFFADKPIQISQNPRHASIDCDFFQLNDTYLVPSLIGSTAGTGTATAVAGAVTFSTSQAGVVAAGSTITVAGTPYQVDTFDGTTGATISNASGLPTFGASTFTRTAASDQYAVTIGTATTNEIRGLFNLHFGGENIWAQGKGGISWVSVAATADAVGITIENARLEQSQNAVGYFLNIDRNAFTVYGVRILNVQPSIAQHGIRLRHCSGFYFNTLYWSDTVGVHKLWDFDATVVKWGYDNLWTQLGGAATLTGQTQVWAVTRSGSVDLAFPTSARYDTATNGAVSFGSNILYASGVREILRFTSGTIDRYQNDNTTLAKRTYYTGREVHPQGITIGTEAAGTILTQVTKYAPSITPASVAANTQIEQTFSVPGLSTSDIVQVNEPGVNPQGVFPVYYRVSAADTLVIAFQNTTAGALTPVAGVRKVIATRT